MMRPQLAEGIEGCRRQLERRVFGRVQDPGAAEGHACADVLRWANVSLFFSTQSPRRGSCAGSPSSGNSSARLGTSGRGRRTSCVAPGTDRSAAATGAYRAAALQRGAGRNTNALPKAGAAGEPRLSHSRPHRPAVQGACGCDRRVPAPSRGTRAHCKTSTRLSGRDLDRVGTDDHRVGDRRDLARRARRRGARAVRTVQGRPGLVDAHGAEVAVVLADAR